MTRSVCRPEFNGARAKSDRTGLTLSNRGHRFAAMARVAECLIQACNETAADRHNSQPYLSRCGRSMTASDKPVRGSTNMATITHRACWSTFPRGKRSSWKRWWRLPQHGGYPCAAAHLQPVSRHNRSLTVTCENQTSSGVGISSARALTGLRSRAHGGRCSRF